MGKGIEVHPMLRCGGAADRIDFRELDFRELDFRELDFRESGADWLGEGDAGKRF